MVRRRALPEPWSEMKLPLDKATLEGEPTAKEATLIFADVASYRVAALVVTNPLGDVVDGAGKVVAGSRGPDGSFLDARRSLVLGSDALPDPGPQAGTNPTLAVVATDAPLSGVNLGRVARTAANALAARIFPVHTPFDGDVVFAVSTAPEVHDMEPVDILRLGAGAQQALEEAITRSVENLPT